MTNPLLSPQQAVLVNLNIALWDPTRTDRTATQVVVAQNNAAAGIRACRVRKTLLSSAQLTKVRSYATTIRNWGYKLTHPYLYDGVRILPSTMIERYRTELAEHKAHFQTLLDAFELTYLTQVEEAKQQLGGLFNQGDYPTESHGIRSKFAIEVQYFPLPVSASLLDIGISLGSDGEAIASQLEKRVHSNYRSSQRSLWLTLSDRIDLLRTTLSSEKSNAKDSSLAALRELANTAPQLAIFHDQQLSQLSQDILAAMAGVSTAALGPTGPGTLRERFIQDLTSWKAVCTEYLMVWSPSETPAELALGLSAPLIAHPLPLGSFSPPSTSSTSSTSSTIDADIYGC